MAMPVYCDGCKKIQDGKCMLYLDPESAIQWRDNVAIRGCINSPKSEYMQSMDTKKRVRVGQQKGKRGKKKR